MTNYSWQKVILYVLGAIVSIALGWLLHSFYAPKPTTEVKEIVKYDTVKVVRQIKFTETKFIDRIITEKDSTRRSYIDSIMGNKNEVEYKIVHIVDIPKEDYTAVSSWDVDLEPKINTITKYVTRDSIRTVVEPKYFQTPFFMNTYFYTTILAALIAVLAIIF